MRPFHHTISIIDMMNFMRDLDFLFFTQAGTGAFEHKRNTRTCLVNDNLEPIALFK